MVVYVQWSYFKMAGIHKKYFLPLSVLLIFLIIQFLLLLSFYPVIVEKSFLVHHAKSDHLSQRSKILEKYSYLESKNSYSKSVLSFVNFTLNCNITTKDAIFAINRAKSYKCKKKLADVSCLAQDQKLYPPELPQMCLKKGESQDHVGPFFNNESRPVRIAFLFAFNGRAVRQVKRLIAKVISQNHVYFIHVDKRQNYLFNELISLERLPNVIITRKRLSTIWGGASLLQMLLQSFEDLIDIPDWDYVVNLSESDYPIKSLRELESFLQAKKGHNFVKFTAQDPKTFLTKQGLDRTFYECDDHMWRLGHRKLPKGIKMNGGSDWVALTRQFVKYIVHGDDNLVKGLRLLYKYTLLPAESFFHSVLQNSKFCDTIVDNNLRLTNWKRKQGCKCQYKHVVDWCGCSPNDFKDEDWSRILTTLERPLFFARKFEPSVNQKIINMVDLMVRGKTKVRLQNLERYWQNDFDLRYDSLDDAKQSYYSVLSFMALEKLNSLCISEGQSFSYESFSDTPSNQATLFFENDTYQGTLVDFSVKSVNHVYNFQFFAKPSNHFEVYKNSEGIQVKAKVCSDYDAKEQIFRNFGCLLHPFSEISVEHTWFSSIYVNITATFVWMDPIDNLAGSFQVKIDLTKVSNKKNTPLVHKPTFELPLRPGVWKLKIFFSWKLVGETSFLIFPFVFYDGNPLNLTQAVTLHSGPLSGKYLDFDFSNIERFLVIKSQPKGKKNEKSDSIRIGNSLLKWAVQLAAKFWTVVDFCGISKNVYCKSRDFCDCPDAPWSSYSPDPKSDILLPGPEDNFNSKIENKMK